MAKNAQQMFGRKSRELAQREFVASLSRAPNNQMLGQKILARSGPEALWTAALKFIGEGAAKAGYELLDHAIECAGYDAPELGCLTNYLALYGNIETLNLQGQNTNALFRRLKALPLGETMLFQLLVAIQNVADPAITRNELLASGLGRYQWRWSSEGQPSIDMLLPDPASAVSWLSHSFVPFGMEQASLRSKLMRLRELLRRKEITLSATETHQAEDPVSLIKLVDQIALKG